MSRRSRERGIALISVLWALLLLSGLAGAAAFVARTEAILTHKLGDLARAESATDAAVVNAIAMLSDEKTSRHPPIDGPPQTYDFQGIPVTVSISNEAGRVDVNTADDDLILAFLNSQGILEDRATLMLSDLRKAQNVARGPAPPGALRSIEELKQIPSWAQQRIDCWEGSLTVYTGLPNVNSADAPEQVEAAIKWAREHHVGNTDWAAFDLSARNLDQSLLGDVIRIVARTAPHSGVAVNSEWIGRLTGDAHQPTLTMKWSRVESETNSSCKK